MLDILDAIGQSDTVEEILRLLADRRVHEASARHPDRRRRHGAFGRGQNKNHLPGPKTPQQEATRINLYVCLLFWKPTPCQRGPVSLNLETNRLERRGGLRSCSDAFQP